MHDTLTPAASSRISYSPSALLQLFNNALNPSPVKTIIPLRGIYQPGRGALYNGVYYDGLKDETTDAQVTLVVPALVRNELTPGKTIAFYGYISKRVVPVGGRIEVHVNITQLLEQMAGKYNEKDLRALEIQQRKSALGCRDVDSYIKTRILRQERVSITILVGKTAIIDHDIRHALGSAAGYYDLRFEKISLSSEAEILAALDQWNDRGLNDLLILSRGGGENQEIFNSPALAEACLSLDPLFLTAIGHQQDTSLVQKIADKAFITPTALGQYLHTIYNDTIAEQEHSKARLVELITTQLKTGYDKEVLNLQEKIRGLEELRGKGTLLHLQELAGLQQQLGGTRELAQAFQVQVDKLEERARAGKVRQLVVWVVVAAIAAVVGWLLGRH
jgi:exodeoxyribonuclease VII large subunit